MSSPVVNVHCHLLNFKCVPDKMTKLLSSIPENIADADWFAGAAGFLTSFIPGPKFERIKSFLKTYKTKNFDKLTRRYVNAMDKADFSLCCPLTMDLEQAVLNPGDKNYPFVSDDGKNQVDLISKQTAAYPWRIFPFFMYDPRRPGVYGEFVSAIEKKGYIGVKLYPALGYHPSPEVLKERGRVDECRRLEALYNYCADNHIPITVHSSIGGAYSTQKGVDVEKDVWPLTDVANWYDVLHNYALKINFAHFGGNYLSNSMDTRLQSSQWRNLIIHAIRLSRRGLMKGRAYTDLSYHDMALFRETKKTYFNDLNNLLTNEYYKHGILFGTDASMISHTWSEKEYFKAFNRGIKSEDAKDLLFSKNALGFLFEDGVIPPTYITFLRKWADPSALTNLPDWVKKDSGKYVVS